jgi:hypothetical protein
MAIMLCPPPRRLLASLLLAMLTVVPARAADQGPTCLPCLAFDRLDKQIRDGALPRAEAERQFTAVIGALDAHLVRAGAQPWPRERWCFPLKGYDLAAAAVAAEKGYVAAGYDYFDGNRHGGHPSFDLFIADQDRDSRDDRTGQPVTVVSMTGGTVVAAEPDWEETSALRGGKYLWVYDDTNRRLVYYAHNSRLLVKVGDRVEPGTPLAWVGRSGFNAAKHRSPTHLHLTVLKIAGGHPAPENMHRQLTGLGISP